MGVNKGDGPRTERVLLTASRARGEPERGRCDDAELSTWRETGIQARREGRAAWVVVHVGALPDGQIAREGSLDPDVLANGGCWVDRLGRALLEAVDGWVATWDLLGEASGYLGEARRAGRVLLDAQATAHVQLGRAAHTGGRGVAPGPARGRRRRTGRGDARPDPPLGERRVGAQRTIRTAGGTLGAHRRARQQRPPASFGRWRRSRSALWRTLRVLELGPVDPRWSPPRR